MGLTGDDQIIQLLFFSWSVFANRFSIETMSDFCSRIRCSPVCHIFDFDCCRNVGNATILTEYLLVVSNMDFLSSFWSETVLHPYNFSIVCYCQSRHEVFWRDYSAMLLLKSSFDQLLRMSWYFGSWYFAKKAERSKPLFFNAKM